MSTHGLYFVFYAKNDTKSHLRYAVNNTKNKTFGKHMKCIKLLIKTIQIHKYPNSQNILRPNDINSKSEKSAPKTPSLQEIERKKRNIFYT